MKSDLLAILLISATLSFVSAQCPTNVKYTAWFVVGHPTFYGKCGSPYLTSCIDGKEPACWGRMPEPAGPCGSYFTVNNEYCVSSCPAGTIPDAKNVCVQICPTNAQYTAWFVVGHPTFTGKCGSPYLTSCVNGGTNCWGRMPEPAGPCGSYFTVNNEYCVDRCPAGTIPDAKNVCVQICPGNAIRNNLGICTNCPVGQYALGSSCVKECSASAVTPLKSINGCVSSCAGIGSGLQAPAGTCYSGATCPAEWSFLTTGTNVCSADCGSAYRWLRVANLGSNNICYPKCTGTLRKSLDALGRNSCQMHYCPSSTPFTINAPFYGGYSETICASACPSGQYLDVPTYQCIAACRTGETPVTNIIGNPNVCKSSACSAYNQRNCPKTTLLSDLLPSKFMDPVPVDIFPSNLFNPSYSLDPNKIYDSITTLIYNALSSTATCASNMFDGKLGCFEILLKTCLSSTTSIKQTPCIDFTSALVNFPYIQDMMKDFRNINSVLNSLTSTDATIEAGKIALKYFPDPSKSVLKVGHYMRMAISTRIFQLYTKEASLMRNYVELFYFSIITPTDIANIYMQDEYNSVKEYIETRHKKCQPLSIQIKNICYVCPIGSTPNQLKTECISCAITEFVSNGKCTPCATGQTRNAAGQCELVCPTDQIKNAAGQCECKTGTYLNTQKTACVTTCPVGQGASGSICVVCDSKSQISSNNKCVPCTTTQYVKNNVCTACATGQTRNAAGQCELVCPTDQIKNAAGQCECKTGTYLNTQKTACVTTCPVGQGASGSICVVCDSKSQISSNNKCVPCTTTQYVKNNVCTACATGQTRNAAGQCELVCPTDQIKNAAGQCECKTGTYLNTQKTACVTTCPVGQGASGSICVVCDSKSQISSNNKCVPCTTTQYVKNNVCTACATGQTRNAAGQCELVCPTDQIKNAAGQCECKTGTYLNTQKTACVTTCPVGQGASGSICVVCDSKSQISSNNKCVPCTTTQYVKNNVCTACATGQTRNAAGQCELVCPTDQIKNAAGQCECKTGTYLNTQKTACVTTCPVGQGASGSICVVCDSKSQISSNNKCVPCTTTQYVKNNVCTACATGQTRNAAGQCELVCPTDQIKNAAGQCECKTGTYLNTQKTACVTTCPVGQGASGSICVVCDSKSQISSNNKCVPCTTTQYVKNNVCTACPTGQTRNAAGQCANPCSTNAIKNNLGTCTNCPVGQYALGSSCVTECSSVGTPLKSINGCVSSCVGIASGMQAPSGSCWPESSCPPNLPFLSVLSKTCSADCGVDARYLRVGGIGQSSMCYPTCADALRNSTDPLGKKACQLHYCPSSSPVIIKTKSIDNFESSACALACPPGQYLDVPTYQCIAACRIGETPVTNITGNPSVCKSSACSAYNQRNCPKTTPLSDLLPSKFMDPIPPLYPTNIFNPSYSLDPNKIYDSITTLIYNALSSTATCASNAFDRNLGCFEILLKTCLSSTASVVDQACLNMRSKLSSYPALKDTIERLANNNTLLESLASNKTMQLIGAGKIAIQNVYFLLGRPSDSFSVFNSKAEFYMVISFLTRYMQLYNPDLIKSTLLRNYVEFFYFSFLPVSDVENILMTDEYFAVSTYLSNIGKTCGKYSDMASKTFELSIGLSTEYVRNLVIQPQAQCWIKKMPNSPIGCVSLGMYVQSRNSVSSIAVFDSIFSGTCLADIYSKCSGWIREENFSSSVMNACQKAVENVCMVNGGMSSPGCAMMNDILLSLFSGIEATNCPFIT